jgi:hypothetical protein
LVPNDQSLVLPPESMYVVDPPTILQQPKECNQNVP